MWLDDHRRVGRRARGPLIREGARTALVGLAIAATVGPWAVVATSARATANSWYLGEKVVCVNNRFLELSDAPELAEGAVYTIRRILPPQRGFLGIAVDETAAKQVFQAFDERRFRPLLGIAERVAAPAQRSASDSGV